MPPPEVFRRSSLLLVPSLRSGTRPVRVQTMLDKEQLHPRPSDIFKSAHLLDTLEKLAQNWLATQAAEHATDIAGLSAMALSSADKLRAASRDPNDPHASVVGGELGRSALDLAGLGVMAAPSAMAYRQIRAGKGNPHLAGGGSRALNAINLASLGALAIPVADRIQARIRGNEDKQLLSDRAHEMLELGGLGGLATGVAREHFGGRSDPGTTKKLLGGYGILAAPSAMALAGGGHHGASPAPPEGGPAVEGAPPPAPSARPPLSARLKPLSELVGLGLLAAPSLAHLGGH